MKISNRTAEEAVSLRRCRADRRSATRRRRALSSAVAATAVLTLIGTGTMPPTTASASAGVAIDADGWIVSADAAAAHFASIAARTDSLGGATPMNAAAAVAITTVAEPGHTLDGYRDYAASVAALRRLTREYGDHCSLSTYGASRGGRDLHVLTIAVPGDVPAAERTSLLLVANVDGDHLVGTESAIRLAEHILRDLSGGASAGESTTADDDSDSEAARQAEAGEHMRAFLQDHAIHIIPMANPDVAQRAFANVKDDHRRGTGRNDADRDGFMDEDPPNDLNGDGVITMMRVFDPEKADMMPDPAEPRLNVIADRNRGEQPEFMLMVEGVDDDGDGEVNEDGRGGVIVNRNFPQGWEQYVDEAGIFPVSEPETKALVDFMLANPKIAVVVNYGRPDSLSTPPRGSGRDVLGKPKDIESDDAGMYAFFGEQYGDAAGTKKPENAGAWNGTFVAWADGQHGVYAFSTMLWSRPDLPKDEKKDADARDDAPERSNHAASNEQAAKTGDADAADAGDDAAGEITSMAQVSDETIDELYQAAIENDYQVTREMVASLSLNDFKMYAQAAGIEIKRKGGSGASDDEDADAAGGGTSASRPADSDKPRDANEAAWLAYSDTMRDGAGFVEWQPYDHPEFGEVEIGGWVPYFRTNPPIDEIDDIVSGQYLALADLMSRYPDVKIESVEATRLADGLYEVEVTLANHGYLPTAPFIGLRNREARPWVIRLENLETEHLMNGNRVELIWRIEGSGKHESNRWLIHTGTGEEAPDALEVTVFSERYGEMTTTVDLPQE